SFHLGVRATIDAARQVLTDEELAALPGLVQRVVLPPEVQILARNQRQVLRDLRVGLAEFIDEGTAVHEPIRLTRFSARTAITSLVAVAAAWILLTTLNFSEIIEMISGA